MSFEHNYPNRKDHRKPYRKSKAIDRSCRSHGSCPWCRGNRLHREYLQQQRTLDTPFYRSSPSFKTPDRGRIDLSTVLV